MSFCSKYGISLLAVTISIIALFISCLRCEPLEMDWMSVLVSILSILVTLLIGWQIYSVLDIKKTVKEIKSNTNKIQEETMARAYTSMMNQTSYIVEGRNEDDNCFNAISNGLYACKHYHLAGNSKESVRLLEMIADFKKDNCRLNKKNITDLWIIIGQLKGENIDVSVIEKWLEEYDK
jgi:uncharacterized protein YneF (UPF0154 family)